MVGRGYKREKKKWEEEGRREEVAFSGRTNEGTRVRVRVPQPSEPEKTNQPAWSLGVATEQRAAARSHFPDSQTETRRVTNLIRVPTCVGAQWRTELQSACPQRAQSGLRSQSSTGCCREARLSRRGTTADGRVATAPPGGVWNPRGRTPVQATTRGQK